MQKKHKSKLPFALLASLFFTSPLVFADTLIADKVRVIDGDTIEIIPRGSRSERVRLLGIDAPESSQEYGAQSTNTLRQCIGSSTVKVEYNRKDKYSRLLGKVYANGVDCNLRQVELGSAWHYKYFSYQQTSADASRYSNAESYAKKRRLGLWANPHPTNPYKYRKSGR